MWDFVHPGSRSGELVRTECIVRDQARTERRPLMNSGLVFEGQGHSRHLRAREPRHLRPIPTAAGRPTAVGSLPPRKTCTDQFLSICGQTLKR